MIEVIDLHKSFDGHDVLKGVNLRIKDGETLVIIGGSGCGKTILLKHIIGLYKSQQGKVIIDGEDVISLSPEEMLHVQQKFGMLFQGAALFDSMSVKENVAFGLRHLGRFIDEERISQIVTKKLEMVGLKGIEGLRPANLSGGMKKRVGLARAIATDPKYILYDEPTTGVDPIMADVINQLICELQVKMRVSSVAVTHDMVSAYKIANRIAMLHQGGIVQIGTPEEIRNTENPVVKQFITGNARGPISL